MLILCQPCYPTCKLVDVTETHTPVPELNLPHRHAGFDIQGFDENVADAAFLSAAALADKAMASGSP